MDTTKLTQLREALEELQSAENRLNAARNASDKRTVRQTVRQIGRQVTALQHSTLDVYPAKYVACRDIGHIWDLVERSIDGAILTRVLQCSRCDMERVDMFDRFGELLSRKYRPSAGYLLQSPGGARLPKQFWRGLEFMIAATEASNGSKVAESE